MAERADVVIAAWDGDGARVLRRLDLLDVDLLLHGIEMLGHVDRDAAEDRRRELEAFMRRLAELACEAEY